MTLRFCRCLTYLKQDAMYDLLARSCVAHACMTDMTSLISFFSDFISLLTYFRGISEKSNKQYYLKFPDKYFFCCPYSGWAFSGAAHGSACKRVHVHKICHTYPTMMKLCTVIPYLTKIQNIYKSRDTTIKLC